MLDYSTRYVERIPETRTFQQDALGPRARRLGRHVNHDPRSLRYLHRGATLPTSDVRWTRTVPAFDQGNVGSCTGNALEGVLATAPFTTAGTVYDEAAALNLYHYATTLDPYPGNYPPDDTGSDGVSVCQAAKKLGLISGYTHATSLAAALNALVAGPIITGVKWYNSMFDPRPDGQVVVDPASGLAGGHEFEVSGLEVATRRIWCWNSWGPGWGVFGAFYLTWDAWSSLLDDDGDATVPVPITVAPPAPTPAPGPGEPLSPETVSLIRALKHKEWDTREHIGWSATVAKRGHEWRRSIGQ